MTAQTEWLGMSPHWKWVTLKQRSESSDGGSHQASGRKAFSWDNRCTRTWSRHRRGMLEGHKKATVASRREGEVLTRGGERQLRTAYERTHRPQLENVDFTQ